MEKYLYWFIHRELYVPYGTMIERIIESTSSFINVHKVIDNNSNPYKYSYECD